MKDDVKSKRAKRNKVRKAVTADDDAIFLLEESLARNENAAPMMEACFRHIEQCLRRDPRFKDFSGLAFDLFLADCRRNIERDFDNWLSAQEKGIIDEFRDLLEHKDEFLGFLQAALAHVQTRQGDQEGL